MRKIIPILLLLVACHHGPAPEEKAAQAAKASYDLLLEGRYDAFVDSKHGADRLPEAWRAEQIDNIRMFADQMEREHKGMKEVRIVNATADTAAHTAQVFLTICFGDSTIEETVIPMVLHDGTWKMK